MNSSMDFRTRCLISGRAVTQEFETGVSLEMYLASSLGLEKIIGRPPRAWSASLLFLGYYPGTSVQVVQAPQAIYTR